MQYTSYVGLLSNATKGDLFHIDILKILLRVGWIF